VVFLSPVMHTVIAITAHLQLHLHKRLPLQRMMIMLPLLRRLIKQPLLMMRMPHLLQLQNQASD
jgi:hypothetical protein